MVVTDFVTFLVTLCFIFIKIRVNQFQICHPSRLAASSANP